MHRPFYVCCKYFEVNVVIPGALGCAVEQSEDPPDARSARVRAGLRWTPRESYLLPEWKLVGIRPVRDRGGGGRHSLRHWRRGGRGHAKHDDLGHTVMRREWRTRDGCVWWRVARDAGPEEEAARGRLGWLDIRGELIRKKRRKKTKRTGGGGGRGRRNEEEEDGEDELKEGGRNKVDDEENTEEGEEDAEEKKKKKKT